MSVKFFIYFDYSISDDLQPWWSHGCAIGQVVSHWLLTTVASVCAQASPVGFVVDKWHWDRFFSQFSPVIIILSSLYIVRFQSLIVASMKMTSFWDIAPCSLVEVHQHFRGAYFFSHQGSNCWWRQYPTIKQQKTFTWLHGTVSQKSVIFLLHGQWVH
jgi:hypothetical protein